jgi:hypothetical protein
MEVLDQIESWFHDVDHARSIFWLKGMAGTEKSTISRTIVRELHDSGNLGANFFFSRGGGDITNSNRAIEQQQDIAHKFKQDQWNHLIYQPLIQLRLKSAIPLIAIVIDALDEYEGEEDVETVIRLLTEAERVHLLYCSGVSEGA